jgi:pyruvate dehydrogenase E1 component alpha subunit
VNAAADYSKESPEPALEELWTDIIIEPGEPAPQNA